MTAERFTGSAEQLHAVVVPDDGQRRIWVFDVTEPAVVLGSTQRDDVVVEDPGVALVRRRSGGGAVWVAPHDPIWVDVVVPRADPLWTDDVGEAFLPVGRAWSEALGTVGFPGTTVHAGPMVRTEWSGLVCFAGTGPGEVLVGGAKVVGISQRRTRAAARFQCALPRVWDPEPLRAALRRPPPPGVLDGCATGVGTVAVGELVDAFATALATERS